MYLLYELCICFAENNRTIVNNLFHFSHLVVVCCFPYYNYISALSRGQHEKKSTNKQKNKKNVSRCEIRSYEAAGRPPRPKSLPHKGFRFLERYLVSFAVSIHSMHMGLRDISHACLFALDCNFPTDRNQLHLILQKIYLDIFDIARSYCIHGHYLNS